MQAFEKLTTTAVPLRAENVDTDQIIPARYLTAVTKAGMGEGLFASWRYQADGSPKPKFVLNQPEYEGTKVLIGVDVRPVEPHRPAPRWQGDERRGPSRTAYAIGPTRPRIRARQWAGPRRDRPTPLRKVSG